MASGGDLHAGAAMLDAAEYEVLARAVHQAAKDELADAETQEALDGYGGFIAIDWQPRQFDHGAAMLEAAKQGDLKIFRMCLEKVALTTREYTTALMCTKDTEVAALLLERGADVHEVDKSGKTALELTDDMDMAALLMSWGAKDSVLLAEQRGDLEAMRRYLDSGVSVDSQAWSKLEKTLGKEDTMALLLGRGASKDIQAQAKDLGYKDLAKDDSLGGLGKGPGWVLAVASELDEDQLGKMVAGLTVPHKPHDAFSTLIHWMEEAEQRTRALRSADPRSADEHADLFVRLQLAVAAFLEDLPGDSSEISETEETDMKVQQLLSTEECVHAINIALRVNAKELFAQPVMQRYVEYVWQGKDLQYELIQINSSWKNHPSGTSWENQLYDSFTVLCRRTMLVLIVLVNLLLLPVIALVPPLERVLKGRTVYGKQVYVLQLPLVKFYLGFTAQLSLALIFTLLPATIMHSTTAVSLLLLWMASGIVWEAKQGLVGDMGMRGHFADYFNRYDLAALVLSTATLLLAAGKLHNGVSTVTTDLQETLDIQRPDEYWASTRALAILVLWLRTLRVLLVSPTFGPYALMFNRMLFNDVLYFLVLLGFLLVGIGAAWYALLESTTYGYSGLSVPGEPWREYSPAAVIEAEGCADELGGIHLITIIFRLLEGALTGSDFFDCARSSTEAPFASWVLSFVFVLLTVVLLINMLIAMCGTCASNTCPHCAHDMLFLCSYRMSKTFDNISEAASTNYLFLKAQMTLSLAQELPTPPPLYVLSFPSELLCATLWLVKRLAPKGSGLQIWATKPSCFVRWATRTDPGQDTATTALSENSTRERTLQRRASKRSRKIMTEGDTIQTRAKAITEYVLAHQADVAQEERWRTSMQRKMDHNHRSFRELVVKANKESQRNQKQYLANQVQMKANQKQNLANQVNMMENQKKILAELYRISGV